eukprot:CCRYP_018714-RA/>CCRYP_018714-RA protein AED:0.74 eAED:1.00 QI:0/-1/0/1/-1/0/1/0/41
MTSNLGGKTSIKSCTRIVPDSCYFIGYVDFIVIFGWAMPMF